MRETASTSTSKGRVTILAPVRRHLDVGTYDKIAFVIEGSGGVRLSASQYPTIESLRGIAGTLPRPLSWRKITEIAQNEHAETAAPLP